MKTIHIIRHAKSSWDQPNLPDIKRPLNGRGEYVSFAMAKVIYHAGCAFEHVFASPAVRAQATINNIAESLSSEVAITWQTDKQLYTFNSYELFDWLSGVDENIQELIIVGHNPALTDFCDELSDANILNIPTCGYVQLKCSEKVLWRDALQVKWQITTFLKPKEVLKS